MFFIGFDYVLESVVKTQDGVVDSATLVLAGALVQTQADGENG